MSTTQAGHFHRKLAGALLAVAALMYFGAQCIALAGWEGIYVLSYNLIDDLGMSTCDIVDDRFATRFVCSTYHVWFLALLMAAAVLLIIAGIVILCSGITQWRVFAVFIAATGLFLISRSEWAAGLIPFFVVVDLFFFSRRHTDPLFNSPLDTRPLIYRPARLMIAILALSSLAGYFLFQLALSHYGIWQRLAFDSSALMVLFIGIAMYTAVPSGKAQAREEKRRAEHNERDSAIVQAVLSSTSDKTRGNE